MRAAKQRAVATPRATSPRVLSAEPAPRAAVPLQWLNAPRQDRSRQTLERILDATEAIIQKHGVDAVTIPAVARAAKSSVGSFYARFPNKSALLSTLHERACDQSVATAEAALDPERWRGVTTKDVIRTFIGFLVSLFRERRSMMLAFTTSLGAEPGFAERRARTAAGIGLCVRGLLLDRRASIGHPRPERAVDMTLRVVTATLEQRNALDAGGEARVAIDDDTLAEELTRLALAYLDVRPGA